MNASWGGALLGLVIACGSALVFTRLRATAPLTLRERIAPFVPHLTAQARDQQPTTAQTLLALLPTGRAGSVRDRESARHGGLEQVSVVATGVGIGSVLGFLLALRGSSGLLVPLLAVVGGIVSELTRSAWRAHAGRVRAQRLSSELPDLAELLAFAVAAGESPPAALARIGGMAGGELGSLISRAASEVRLGTPFELALRDLVSNSESADVERFVDALLIAIERGTPLAEVLRAQAADARAAQARRLMESAGRKDVAMLIPVVFLVLPTVVLIALFPGFRSLHLFIN